MGSRWLRNGFIYLLILVAVVAIVYSFFGRSEGLETENITKVISDAKAGRIDEIVVSGDTLTIKNDGQDLYKAKKEPGTSLIELLRDDGVDVGAANGIDVVVKSGGGWGAWLGPMITFLPLLLFGGILIFFMRQAQGANSQAMSFGKSKAKTFTGNRPTVTFDDVAGVDEAKEELAMAVGNEVEFDDVVRGCVSRGTVLVVARRHAVSFGGGVESDQLEEVPGDM